MRIHQGALQQPDRQGGQPWGSGRVQSAMIWEHAFSKATAD